MRQKPVPGARGRAGMAVMAISAWFAEGREVFWWPNRLVNALTVKAPVRSYQGNFTTDVKYAMELAGRMSSRPAQPVFVNYQAGLRNLTCN
jgi:hypothetical protein